MCTVTTISGMSSWGGIAMSPKFLGLENFSLSSVSASAAAYNTLITLSIPAQIKTYSKTHIMHTFFNQIFFFIFLYYHRSTGVSTME